MVSGVRGDISDCGDAAASPFFDTRTGTLLKVGDDRMGWESMGDALVWALEAAYEQRIACSPATSTI
jgi:hypothetical protein